MNVIEAINRYADYRINLGEKARKLKYLLLGFGKYAGSHQSLDSISEGIGRMLSILFMSPPNIRLVSKTKIVIEKVNLGEKF